MRLQKGEILCSQIQFSVIFPHKVHQNTYCIVLNISRVKIFTDFADLSLAAKIYPQKLPLIIFMLNVIFYLLQC